MPDPIYSTDGLRSTAASNTTLTEDNIVAIVEAMGWQRIPGTSRVRLPYPDGCGVCGNPAREYDVALGIPVCSRTCGELAS